mmetsp:Transcript_3321/g.6346  ORF Transcript_3321/g.6346 Transcript_3321/m.6346 type:complete len:152 (+) Transcript_3321:117-572(+)
MMFLRNLSNSMRSSAVARHLSTNPQRISEPVMKNMAPVVRTNVPHASSLLGPNTVSPSYDIKESPLDYQVSVNLPKNLRAGDLTIEIEKGAKALRITGDSADENGAHFSKRFSWGGIMDVDRLQTNMDNGRIVIQAPKVHYLNGNSFLNSV